MTRPHVAPLSSPSEPSIDVGVLPRGAVPPEILRHAVALHLAPCVAIAIGVVGAPDRRQKRCSLRLVEYETGRHAGGEGLAVAVHHRIDKPAGGPYDRRRAIALAVHLVHAAGFEARWHK